MKCLVVAYDWPTEDGGYNKSIKSCIQQYSKFYDVDICVLSDSEKDIAHIGKVYYFNIERKKLLRSFLSSLTTANPAVEFRYSKVFKKFKEIPCDQYSVIIVQGILLGNCIDYFSTSRPIKKVLMSHDLFHVAYHNLWKTKPWLMKLPWVVEEAALRRHEASVVKKYDFVYAITQKDMSGYHSKNMPCDGVFTRFPVTSLEKPWDSHAISDSIITIGKIDDRKKGGLESFISKVWPDIRKSVDVTFHIAGKGCEQFEDPNLNIKAHGFVNNKSGFYSLSPIFLNPQETGAGLQFKIIDALANRKIVVTSELSYEGLPESLKRYVLCYKSYTECKSILIKLFTDEMFLKENLSLMRELKVEDFTDSLALEENNKAMKKWCSE